jgi:hypothetical protein
MKISTISEPQRLERVFHNVVARINVAILPDLPLAETKMFEITGGVIRSITDGGKLVVSLVDEMVFDMGEGKYIPAEFITVYAYKYDGEKPVPVKKWSLRPTMTDEIAFVIAHFFLGHSYKLNRHFSGDNVRGQFMISAARRDELIGTEKEHVE